MKLTDKIEALSQIHGAMSMLEMGSGVVATLAEIRPTLQNLQKECQEDNKLNQSIRCLTYTLINASHCKKWNGKKAKQLLQNLANDVNGIPPKEFK
ncbi:hypothetical protein [Pseudoalteromonas phage J2-1_QLiu-2017]|nr:hypothetical protein [Pseudoalteromonas phage J2-1_QLiu-2017]